MKKCRKLLMSSAVMLSLCIGFGSVAGASAYETNGYTFIMPGDADSSRNVDINDATLIQQHLAACKNIEIDLSVSDYDGDGSVTVDDVTSIQKMLAGYTDYACVITPEEYLAYEGDTFDVLPEYNSVEYSWPLFGGKNIIFAAKGENTVQIALITSKEEFFALFKCYSPEFDEDYFEENALVVLLADDSVADNRRGDVIIGVSDNALCIRYTTRRWYPNSRDATPTYWHYFCQVSKSDISNVDEILVNNYEMLIADP